jgi:hypothetical protein
MERTFIIGSTVDVWQQIKSLLLSDDTKRISMANKLIEKQFSENAKEIIIDHLNFISKEWHFFLDGYRINRELGISIANIAK